MGIPAFLVNAALYNASGRLNPLFRWFQRAIYSELSHIFAISELDIQQYQKLAAAEKVSEDFSPKSRYYYVTIKTSADVPLNPETQFAVCAIPVDKEGNPTFLMNETGKIYYKDTGGRPVHDFPPDLAAAGWKQID